MATPKKPGRPVGSKQKRKPTAEELAKKVGRGKVEDNPAIADGAVHVCTCCGEYATKTTLTSKFFISYSPYHAYVGRVPFCKDCVIRNSTIRGELVIEMFVEVIRMMDKPFINNVFESSINEAINDAKKEYSLADREYVVKKKASQIIGAYIKNISMPQSKDRTWLDGDQRYINKDNMQIMMEDIGDDVSTDELIFKWGEGLTENDFMFLENRYNSIYAMGGVEFEADIMMLKQIALEELNIRKMRAKNTDVSKQLECLQKLMATANIRPTDIKNANADLLNDSYGKWLNVIEEYEPAEYFEDKPLFDDFDGIKKYMSNWVLRPLKNLLKGTRDFNIED